MFRSKLSWDYSGTTSTCGGTTDRLLKMKILPFIILLHVGVPLVLMAFHARMLMENLLGYLKQYEPAKFRNDNNVTFAHLFPDIHGSSFPYKTCSDSERQSCQFHNSSTVSTNLLEQFCGNRQVPLRQIYAFNHCFQI